uniref:Uncharacterized protein n=1 Tax=Brassica oleracea TaxID=3712 RepID=A0A3P6EP06_BRAOL|nr:unnamed protein product [Brassica oleracea]
MTFTTDSRNYAWRTITLRHTILRTYFNILSTKKNAKASIIYAKHPLVRSIWINSNGKKIYQPPIIAGKESRKL